jgi:tetratricopeptide (TPR) repeat protein
MGDLDLAQQDLSAILAASPCAAAYGVAAEAALLLNDGARRDEMLARGIESDPDHYMILRAVAVRAMMGNRWDEARHAIERSLALYPRDPEAMRALLLVHRTRNDREAEDAALDSPPEWFRGTPQHHRGRFQRAIARRDLAAAETEANSAVAASSGHDAQAWSDLAMVQMHLNKLGQAEQSARNALDLNARQANAYGTLAALALRRGDAAQADAYRKKAAEAIPALKGQPLLVKANAALRRGDFRAAESAFRAAERVGPSFTSRVARSGLVQMYVVNEDWARARRELDRAIEADGLNENLRALRAPVLIHESRLDEAEADIIALTDCPAPHPSAIATAILFWRDRGRDDRIQALADYVLAALPGSSSDLAAIVIALDRVGLPDEARRLFEKAERRYPADEALRLIAVGMAAQAGQTGHFRYELSRLPRDARRRLFGPALLLKPWFWRAVIVGLWRRKKE